MVEGLPSVCKVEFNPTVCKDGDTHYHSITMETEAGKPRDWDSLDT